MVHLALALFVTAAISFAFRSTRPIGVLCVGLFTFLHSWVGLGLAALIALLAWLHHTR